MTETSYTAWDDKLYQWPPPDGWYQASDGKWWPEGYGPDPAEEPQQVDVAGAGEVAPLAAVDEIAGGAPLAEVDSLPGPEEMAGSASPWAEIGGQNGQVSAGSVDDLAAQPGGPVSTVVDESPTWDDLTSATDAGADAIDGVGGRPAESAGEALGDAAADPVDGLLGTPEALGGLIEGAADSGGSGLGDLPDSLLERTSELPRGFATDFGDSDATQVIPSELPPPPDALLPGSGAGPAPLGDLPAPGEDAPSFDPPPPGLGAPLPFDAPPPSVGDAVPFDAPPPPSVGDALSFDAPPPPSVGDAVPFDAPPPPSVGDALSFDAPPPPSVGDAVPFDAPPPSVGDAVPFDAPPPGLDAPGLFEAPSFDEPSFDAPPAAPLGGPSSASPENPPPAGLGSEAPPPGESEGSVADLDALPPPGLGDAARAFTALGGGDPLTPPGLDQPPSGSQPPRFDSPFDGGLGVDIPDVDVPSAESAPGSIPSFDAPPSFTPSDARATTPFDPSVGTGLGGLDTPGGPLDETLIAPGSAGPGQPDAGFSAPAAAGQALAGQPDRAPWVPDAPLAQPDQMVPPSPGSDQPGPAAGGWGQGHFDGSGQMSGFDQSALLEADDGPQSSKTVLMVVIGVVALLVIGAGLYFLFGGGDGGVTDTGGEGSFSNPHARSTGVEVSYPAGESERLWIVEVLDPVRDASAEGNATPGDGGAFAATRVRVQNRASDMSAPIGELRFNVVSGDGEVIDRESSSCSVSTDPFDFAAALPPGGSTEGTVCWEVPAGAVTGLLLGVESTEVSGRVHIRMD